MGWSTFLNDYKYTKMCVWHYNQNNVRSEFELFLFKINFLMFLNRFNALILKIN